MPIEITESDLSIARAVARSLGGSMLGKLAGDDELESLALLTLWELTLSFDESRGVPWRAYIWVTLKRRMLDTLRKDYGRYVKDKPNARLEHHLRTESLEESMEEVGQERATTPGPEQTVMARDELRRLADYLRPLSALERASVLWPAYSTPAQVAEDLGVTTARLNGVRGYRKPQARKALDRPVVA